MHVTIIRMILVLLTKRYLIIIVFNNYHLYLYFKAKRQSATSLQVSTSDGAIGNCKKRYNFALLNQDPIQLSKHRGRFFIVTILMLTFNKITGIKKNKR